MVRNIYKVDRNQWRKWNERQRALFNGLHADILQIKAPRFCHPKTVARKISKAEFSTIAWNAAWLAADHLRESKMISQVVTR